MAGTVNSKKIKNSLKWLRTEFEIRRLRNIFYESAGGITVHLRHGVGNKLLQYAIGRVLAERTGLKMTVSFEASRHDAGLSDPLGELLSTFNLTTDVPGSSTAGIPRILRSDTCADIMSVQGDTPLIVYGQFFRYEYLKPYKSLIKNDWLTLKASVIPQVNNTTACVHMRFGDLAQAGKSLNIDYYKRAVESMNWDELNIVTDDPCHPIVKQISSRYGGTIVNNPGWASDFRSIAAHKTIAICESTFSWWAAWLSDAEVVVSPGPKLDVDRYGGYWPTRLGKNNPYVDDESRYIFLN